MITKRKLKKELDMMNQVLEKNAKKHQDFERDLETSSQKLQEHTSLLQYLSTSINSLQEISEMNVESAKKQIKDVKELLSEDKDVLNEHQKLLDKTENIVELLQHKDVELEEVVEKLQTELAEVKSFFIGQLNSILNKPAKPKKPAAKTETEAGAEPVKRRGRPATKKE